MPLYKQSLDDIVALAELLPLLPNAPASIIPGSFRNPNFVPTSRKAEIYAVVISTTIITTAFAATKLYTRLRGSYGWDDLFTAISWFCFVGFSLVNGLGVHFAGLSYHVYDLSIRDLENSLKVFMAHSLFYVLVGTFTRISALLLFIRIASITNAPRYKHCIQALIAISSIYMVTALELIAFGCHPLNMSFDIHAKLEGKCLDYPSPTVYYVLMAVRTALDAAIIFSPFPAILSLNLSTGRKANLIVLLLLGLITVGCGLVRMYWAYGRMIHNYDQTWNATDVSVLGQIESMFAVVVGCLPALNALMIRKVPGLTGRSNGGSASASRKTPFASRGGTAAVSSTDGRMYSHKTAESKTHIITSAEDMSADHEIEMDERRGEV